MIFGAKLPPHRQVPRRPYSATKVLAREEAKKQATCSLPPKPRLQPNVSSQLCYKARKVSSPTPDGGGQIWHRPSGRFAVLVENQT